MRVLFTLLPSQGSLHGVLPLAMALERAGHQVAFSSSASFEPAARRYGFEYFPAGLDWQVSDADLLQRLADAAGGPDLAAPAGSEPFEWVSWAMNNDFMRDIARAMAPDVAKVATAWDADLVAPNAFDLGGILGAELAGVPHASVATSAGTITDLTERLAEPVTWLRDKLGLATDPEMTRLYRYLHLGFEPPMFSGPDAIFPDTAHFVQRTSIVRPGDRLPAWAGATSGRPTILVSLGTVFHRALEVYRAVVETLRDDPVELAVAVGFDQDPAELGPQPPNVHIERWLPVPLLLPHCDLLIGHAGSNSTMEALAAGVPLVVMPMAGDQPYCGDRCESLGVARVLSPYDRGPARICETARLVLGDPAYRAAAERVRDANAALPALDTAVDLLETVAAERRPLHRINA